MKKSILAIGLLVVSISVNAQFISYVGNNTTMYVGEGALYNSKGNFDVVGTGVVHNRGNVRIDGGFYTSSAINGGSRTQKQDGGNFILYMNQDDPTWSPLPHRNYGQLWINNTNQNELTGIVDKQYKEVSHGAYQQIGLPFYDKTVSSLNTEISTLNITNNRWNARGSATGTNLLTWNNKDVRHDLVNLETKTTKGTNYFILGVKNLTADYFANNTTVFKGRPYASGDTVKETLQDAGKDVNFGTNGNARNSYNQKYNTYLGDYWEQAAGQTWTGNYGKNIYQFSNPFLTNIDLTLLPDETKNRILGIRYEMTGTSTNLVNQVVNRFISFTSNGVSVGDIAAIVKPMQQIAIKLKDNNSPVTIDFSTLRTFSDTSSNTNYKHSATAKRAYNYSVKQLEVLLLDSNKNEIDRTYYVVYPDAHTGGQAVGQTQVAISSSNVIATLEEDAKKGGVDANFKGSYWLYINEANENDFKGKEVPLVIYNKTYNGKSVDAAYIKVNVRENMQLLADNESRLSTGESFFVSVGEDLLEAKQGMEYKIAGKSVFNSAGKMGLYYGKPTLVTLTNTEVSRPSDTRVVLDDSDKLFKVIFDRTWNKASVDVYDMSGRVIYSAQDVKTNTPHTLVLPNKFNGIFTVVSVSDAGEKYVQKIKK